MALGQVTLKAALGLAAGTLTVGGVLWKAAADAGQKELRLVLVEERTLKTAGEVEKLKELPAQVQRIGDSVERIENVLIAPKPQKKR